MKLATVWLWSKWQWVVEQVVVVVVVVKYAEETASLCDEAYRRTVVEKVVLSE